MYPSGELTRLAHHKAALRFRIAHRRLEVAEAYTEVERPLRWVERALAWWEKINPIAKLVALPGMLLLRRTFFRRLGVIGSLLRWSSILFTAGKAFRAMRHPAQTEPTHP